MPIYQIPPEFNSQDDYVRHIVYTGLEKRYKEITPEIKERAEYELGIIFSMGFSGYFLIVWDFINWAKNNDVPIGPGRGSGAGSLVAYAMTITDIDPFRYKLIFERFLNPERISMPDFDVDFSDELSIMYMFRENMLIAKLYIKYVLDGDIEPILRQFQDYGMYLCVRTYDPNIDEDMICAKLQLKNPPVKVVRYRRADDVRGVMERVDSGFVTYGSPKSLLQLLPYCDKTIHTKRTCGALTVMAVVVALMMLSVFAMSSGISALNSLYITIYHIVWVFFSFVASRLFIR